MRLCVVCEAKQRTTMMKDLLVSAAVLVVIVGGELLQNKGMESMAHWSCWAFHCNLTSDRHSGQHAMEVTRRHHNYDGPMQVISVTPGHAYTAKAFVKLLNDKPDSESGQVSAAANINKADVKFHVLQTRKSFPFGTAVKARQYNDPALHKYRDFIHKHFNWAVPGIALKWPQLEKQRGHTNYQPALDMIHGLRQHGLKVRGHNLVWSKPNRIQPWIQQLNGTELRNVVKHHIEETMNVTRGLLEHCDVNNENLHGTWYQDRLHDPDYNLEIFRIAHHADPNVKLFLNEFGVVAQGQTTYAYLEQGRHFKAANVGMYGMGVQCHFDSEQEPVPALIKERLDLLAKAGVPLWATELDVMVADENKRADYYEKALRALYGHPAIEGILFWGFWDQAHWRGEKAALVKGDNLELTAAGRRVLGLYENQWMTDETHALPEAGDQFAVRGFHGDYEVHVMYQGRELTNIKKTFQLGKDDTTLHINVHT